MDQFKFTELLILSKALDGPLKPSVVSVQLGITRQAVSYHLKSLRNRGYISEEKITPTGVQYLYTGLRILRDQISSTLRNMDNTQIWEAVADCQVNSGDTVYLYMHDGFLMASKKRVSEASARCIISANAGEVTGVSSIEGIIPLEPARLKIMVIPDRESIHENREIREKIRNACSKSGFVSAIGEYAYYEAKNSYDGNVEFFGAMEAAFDAAQRGITSTIVSSRRRFMYETARLESLILSHPGVKTDVEEI